MKDAVKRVRNIAGAGDHRIEEGVEKRGRHDLLNTKVLCNASWYERFSEVLPPLIIHSIHS